MPQKSPPSSLLAGSRGRLGSYVGIQMFDATGRLGGVITKPSDKPCVSVAFAGRDRSWLYACVSDKVFLRKTLTHGFYLPGNDSSR
jgi:sugar lactone lactonase YvrE